MSIDMSAALFCRKRFSAVVVIFFQHFLILSVFAIRPRQRDTNGGRQQNSQFGAAVKCIALCEVARVSIPRRGWGDGCWRVGLLLDMSNEPPRVWVENILSFSLNAAYVYVLFYNCFMSILFGRFCKFSA